MRKLLIGGIGVANPELQDINIECKKDKNQILNPQCMIFLHKGRLESINTQIFLKKA